MNCHGKNQLNIYFFFPFFLSLKVWQTDYLVCSHTYRPAHSDMIISSAIHPEQNDLVVSCAEDGVIVMWDLRMPKPALRTYKLSFMHPDFVFILIFFKFSFAGIAKKLISRPSCVAFVLGRRNGLDLMVGTVSGHLLHLDASNPDSMPTLELGAHSQPVRSICPVGEDAPFMLASCADDRRVVVVSVDPAHHNIMYVT